MKTWSNRITISDDVAKLLSENALDTEVDFTYIHQKKFRERTIKFPLGKAIKLAENRMNDKRYRNYEIHIG